MRKHAANERGADGASEFDRDLLVRASRHPFTRAVGRAWSDRCMLAARDAPVLVGASGGPDSTALLVALAALASRRRPCVGPPIAVTIDHGLRREAADECALVERLAARLGIRCLRRSIAPGARSGNIAANGRIDRLRVYRDVAREVRATVVALGHHADDRLETLLVGLARGRGVAGACAPPWRRPLVADGSIVLARPLLRTSKAELVAVCTDLGLDVASDPGNRDVRRARGFLRTTILPSLEARWPSIARHAGRFADEAALAVDAIDALADRTLGPRGTTSWPRSLLRATRSDLVLWTLRRAVASIDPTEPGGQRTWDRVVAAVYDGPRPGGDRPKTLRVGCATIAIDARTVAVGPTQTTAADGTSPIRPPSIRPPSIRPPPMRSPPMRDERP